MNVYISPLERIILESIQRKSITLKEISADTEIEKGILQNIINSLLIKGLIKTQEDSFSINNNISPSVLEAIKNKENTILECNEMVRASIKVSFKEENLKSFRLKKSCLTETQKKLLNAMLFNIESFLDECSLENKNMKTKDQTLIFWGANSYHSLTQNILETL